MHIELSNKYLDSLDINSLWIERHVPKYNEKYFALPSGQEHYRLLIHLSQCYSGAAISDVGTNTGASALALSTNTCNSVYSVDIVNCRDIDVSAMKNCRFAVGNVLYRDDIFESVVASDVIMLDIDHQYHNEIQIYQKLLDANWSGLLICDDIHLNEPMKKFWSEITLDKIDITRYGHWSGTGCVLFNKNINISLV